MGYNAQMVTSLHGRRIGLDKDDFIVGAKDVRKELVALTSASTATPIPAHGMATIKLTTLSTPTFLLSNPVPGAEVLIQTIGVSGSVASSNITLVRSSTAFYIQSSDGSTMTTIAMTSQAHVSLMGLTSALYSVSGRSETTASVSLSGTS